MTKSPPTRRRTPVLTTLLIASAVVAVLGGGAAAWHWWERQGPTPAHAAGTDGISLGPTSATTVVDVYLDPVCPGCQGLVAQEDAQISALLDQGAQVRYHVVAFLDGETKDELSSRAANAAYCASDYGRFRSYLTAMVRSISTATGTSDEQLIEFGRQNGITAEDFESCVRSERYGPFLRRVSDTAVQSGVRSVPRVLVNGTSSSLPNTVSTCTSSGQCHG
jgi:protein-disulfide isomerase